MALTQVDQGLLSSTAQYTGFKNRIINGAMGIWQRGTSGFTSGAYGPDRFIVSASSGLTAAQSSDVPSGFKYSLSLSGTGYPQAIQRIESVNCTDLVGQSVTLSFWAKQTSGAGAASLGVLPFYANASDNFSTVTQIGSGQTFTGTTGWVQYSYTVTSLPAQVANGLQVIVYANTAGASTWLVTGVQLEKGSTATSFDYRPYGTELALCQRYCPVWAVSGSNVPFASGGGQCVSSTGAIVYLTYPVTPRVSATGVTISGTTRVYTAAASGNSLSSLSYNNSSDSVIQLYGVAGTANLVAGNATSLIGIDAKIIGTGCEL